MNIVRISDGLGNQMFQYAFARKLHKMTGRKVYLDTRFINNEDIYKQGKNSHMKGKLAHREYGLQHFRIKLPTMDESLISCWCGCLRRQNEAENFKGELSKMQLMIPAYYQGYFFDLKYYDDMKTVLQHEFSLKEKIRLPDRLQETLSSRNTVSIHIRRGDFLKMNRDISGSGYYEKAVQVMQNKVENPVYLLFSDDMEWVKENLRIPGEKLYVSGMGWKDYEELTIMKHCRHHIIANSTFSYWAAYLNADRDKVVIYPQRWRTKTIPKGWICV